MLSSPFFQVVLTGMVCGWVFSPLIAAPPQYAVREPEPVTTPVAVRVNQPQRAYDAAIPVFPAVPGRLPMTALQTAVLPAAMPFAEVCRQPFQPLVQLSPTSTIRRAPLQRWIRFGLHNPGTDTVLLWCGFGSVEPAHLYQVSRGGLTGREMGAYVKNAQYGTWQEQAAYGRIYIPPGDTVYVWFAGGYFRHRFNDTVELLTDAAATARFAHETRGYMSLRQTGWAMVVLLGFMGLFFGMQYLQSSHRPMGYYAAYVWAMGLFFLYHAERLETSAMLLACLPNVLVWNELPFIALANLAYLQFVHTFFGFSKATGGGDRIFRYLIGGHIALVLLSLLGELFFYEEGYVPLLYDAGTVFASVAQIVSFLLIARKPGAAERMVRIGGAVLIVVNVATGIIPYPQRVELLGPDHLIVFKAGVVLEILLFAGALGLQTRRHALDREKALHLRAELARDLHDDLGSTLSSISILSEAMVKSLPDPAAQQCVSALGERAREVMDAMDDIVWGIHPGNDSMEQMLHRMKEFAVDMLETQDITLHFEATATLPALAVPMEKRKDLYLIFKEAINNAAKYSGATEVWVQVRHNNGRLHIEIRDNGRGFDEQYMKPGNGLRNMHQRAGQMGGTCQIVSKPGEGTKILAVVPYS